ncbi:4'-phosphopantetheinyl transferase family protein [Dyella choica]|uniref:4'-phosphopantetheinyl transferase superfamily protein n=1 Tax=Dyella choica TaxID=1927959 RepID=A0A432M5N8_9GAMM|nr:4'-phosphopantetheinyl transferase superfamily protein [Dyella choica]RUL75366.1 4'-phosphopantetheinyl transferase superfamily protein [Dyella choica]
MRTSLGQDVAGIAAGLGKDQIHVWRLGYDRDHRRAPLCALLGSYLGLPASAVTLVEGEHGRPELAEPWGRQLQFNWSHTGKAALVAIARDCSPGVDIERLRPRPRAMQLAERYFHPEETVALAKLDESQREQAFLQLWTAKEAVLKAMGRGIAFGLERLRLAVAPASPGLLWLDGDDATQWQLHPLSPDIGHVASVAWRGSARELACWTLADSG